MAGTGQRGSGRPGTGSRIRAVHCDTIQATGFLEHIKLPHYVDFQSELELIRKLRREAQGTAAACDVHPKLPETAVRAQVCVHACRHVGMYACINTDD